MLARIMCLAVAGGAVLLAFNTREDRGKDLFTRRCSGCHALDLNKEGPPLRNVYGRKRRARPAFLIPMP
jgi:cytochrome c